MSARRLAIRQPETFALTAKAKKEIATWVKKYPKERQRSALIPALWIAQKDAGGWLPELALRELGDMLDMAYIRVYEVATFYTMFNLEPVGMHFVQMCGTTPCWLRGSDELKEMLTRKIGPQRSISEDGKLSWLEVECLGSCSNAPMVQISNGDGDHYYEDLTAEALESVLDDLVAGKKPAQGPKNGRFSSEPIGGAIALTSEDIYNQEAALKALPNAGKKAEIIYHNADPKGRRATVAGRKEKPRMPARTKKSVKPKVLYTDGPTDGTPDDLKLIKGVGPKFEKELNANGVYYFRQVGAWKVSDVKVVEEKIKSLASGRVKRDDWVKQGKALAKAAAKKGKS